MDFPDIAIWDIAGLLRASARHIFTRRNNRDDLARRLETRDGSHGSDHGGAAAHVVLHFLPCHSRVLWKFRPYQNVMAFPDQAKNRAAAFTFSGGK